MSLDLHRQSFEQQINDAEHLINESADQMCRYIENERQRLLRETTTIHHNTATDLDKASQNGDSSLVRRLTGPKGHISVMIA